MPAYVLLAALAVIVVLLTVVAIVARAVVAKARPQETAGQPIRPVANNGYGPIAWVTA